MKTSCTLASWSNAHLGRGLCLEWSATCPASLSFWYWVTIFNHIHTHTQVNQRKILPWTDTAEGILHFLHCPLPIWLSVTFHLSPEWRVQTPSANNIESIPRASHCSQPRAGVRSSCSAGVGGSPLSKCRSLSLTRCPPTPAPHSPGIMATQAAAFLQAPHARAPRPPPTTGGSFLTLSGSLPSSVDAWHARCCGHMLSICLDLSWACLSWAVPQANRQGLPKEVSPRNILMNRPLAEIKYATGRMICVLTTSARCQVLMSLLKKKNSG